VHPQKQRDAFWNSSARRFRCSLQANPQLSAGATTPQHRACTRTQSRPLLRPEPTDQFLSVDPDLAETGQPYAFTGDDPLNANGDPLGGGATVTRMNRETLRVGSNITSDLMGQELT
jgi:hypothetical protein